MKPLINSLRHTVLESTLVPYSASGNLINVVFVLAFLCSLAVYIPLLCLMSSLLLLLFLSIIKYILLVGNKALRFETHCVWTHFIGAPCEDGTPMK